MTGHRDCKIPLESAEIDQTNSQRSNQLTAFSELLLNAVLWPAASYSQPRHLASFLAAVIVSDGCTKRHHLNSGIGIPAWRHQATDGRDSAWAHPAVAGSVRLQQRHNKWNGSLRGFGVHKCLDWSFDSAGFRNIRREGEPLCHRDCAFWDWKDPCLSERVHRTHRRWSRRKDQGKHGSRWDLFKRSFQPFCHRLVFFCFPFIIVIENH